MLISAHDLEIEKGRYNNSKTEEKVPRNLRLCRYCKEVLNKTVTEDEEHALNICPLYTSAREKTLNHNNTQYNHTATTSITHLLNQTLSKVGAECEKDTTLLYQISKLCNYIFDYRKAFIKYLNDYTDWVPTYIATDIKTKLVLQNSNTNITLILPQNHNNHCDIWVKMFITVYNCL